MDTVCRCGEPWDWWTIRDEVLEDQTLYEKMEKLGGYVKELTFGDGYIEITQDQLKGSIPECCWQFKPGPHPIQCPACFGKDVEPSENSFYVEALQDIFGDDVDGLMSELEDFGLI